MPYSPWETLRGLPHLTLAITRLPAGRAWWIPDLDGIVLDDRLNQAERRSALEHELQHAEHGDVCLADGGPDGPRLSRRRERAVDARAASRLIDLGDLADALTWALDPAEVADALNVDARTVRARIHGLTPAEKAHIEHRIQARGDAA